MNRIRRIKMRRRRMQKKSIKKNIFRVGPLGLSERERCVQNVLGKTNGFSVRASLRFG